MEKTVQTRSDFIEWVNNVNETEDPDALNELRAQFALSKSEIIEQLFIMSVNLDNINPRNIIAAILKSAGEESVFKYLQGYCNWYADRKVQKHFEIVADQYDEFQSEKDGLLNQIEELKRRLKNEKEFVNKLKGFLDRVREEKRNLENQINNN
ncbi:MAG: hypothetical protein IAE91_10120 [Ignavibacteriaceae bacterium]|nr:hypothetical protein [Ignavibacteriaceae bacterium]